MFMESVNCPPLVHCTDSRVIQAVGSLPAIKIQSPGEIKRKEVVLNPQVSPEKIKSREVELGLRVGLLLLQLFPNGGATDIVFVLHSSWDSSGVVRWSLRNAGRTLPLHSVVLAAVHGSLGLPGWRPFRGFTLLSPFSPSLLAYADVKQQSLSLSVSRVTVQS